MKTTLTAKELALYLGGDVRVRKKKDFRRGYLIGRICEVTSGSNHGDWVMVWFNDVETVTNDTWNELSSNSHTFFLGHDEVNPILRKLSSMTEEEAAELISVKAPNRFRHDWDSPTNRVLTHHFWIEPERIQWYLSKSFDLFGYIESGLALDAETIKKEK